MSVRLQKLLALCINPEEARYLRSAVLERVHQLKEAREDITRALALVDDEIEGMPSEEFLESAKDDINAELGSLRAVLHELDNYLSRMLE